MVTFWENPFTRYWQVASIPGAEPEIVQAMFAPSAILTPIGEGWHNLAQKLPGMIGVVAEGMSPVAAPFGAQPFFPDDGKGLNPLLRHPGMIIHPPGWRMIC